MGAKIIVEERAGSYTPIHKSYGIEATKSKNARKTVFITGQHDIDASGYVTLSFFSCNTDKQINNFI